jgi:hypothetical protein
MEKLFIEPGFKTPQVSFDAESGLLEISGRVFPENPNAFFQPLLAWIEAYLKEPASKTTLKLFLSYFNSSANEYLFRCCKWMENLKSQGREVKIIWEYEEDDEDMKQMGEDYRDMLKIIFELKAVA